MNVKQKVMLAVIALCGLIAAGAVFFWATPCTGTLELANGNAVPMRCTYTGKIAALFGFMLVASAVYMFMTKKNEVFFTIMLALGMIIITFESSVGIGVCKSEMMCWDMALWLRLTGGVALIASFASLLLSDTRKVAPLDR